MFGASLGLMTSLDVHWYTYGMNNTSLLKARYPTFKKFTVVRPEIRNAVPKADISKFKVYLSKIYTMKLI